MDVVGYGSLISERSMGEGASGSMSGRAIYQMILLMLVRDKRDIYSHFISDSLRPIGREPQRELMFQSNQSH